MFAEKGHLTIRFYKKKKVGNEYSDYEQGTQVKSEESESVRSHGYTHGRGGNREYFRGRGRTDGALRGGGHQISFCKLGVNKKSDDGIESIRMRVR